MDFLRATARAVALCLATALSFLGLLLCKPVHWVSRPLGARAHDFWVRSWARVLLWILNVRIETTGAAPEPPFFLVANHLSYVDILVFHSLVRGHFLAKSEIAHWPIMGVLARGANTLFINRTNRRDIPRVIQEVRQILDDGKGIIVFPEGTSTKGEVVAPFKASTFEVAVHTGTDVSTAALSFRTPPGSTPAHLSVCWWGDMFFLGHVWDLLSLPRIDCTVDFGATVPAVDDRKALARAAQDAVEELFVPVVSGDPWSAVEPCVR